MKMNHRHTCVFALSMALLVATSGRALVQAQQSQTLPASTNPANRVIYPAEGQDEQQQMADQLECYRYSTEQTHWDPYVAYDTLVEKGYAAKQTAEDAQGGLVQGAARGAVVGLAIGAIAGDAGKGAAIGAVAGGVAGGSRSRRAQQQAQSDSQAAVDAFNRQMEKWDRNYVACMQARDYVVN